ncbi:hypothetical protein EBS80_03875 [bacterium]|nr:hypothetical protein [bacterium]
MNIDQRHVDAVKAAWGNPNKVAEAGLNLLWSLADKLSFGTDHDDQASNALRAGVVAGLTAGETPEIFIEKLVAAFRDDG